MDKTYNVDAREALKRGEHVCFWCEDPFYKSQKDHHEAVRIDRIVCDNNGSHMEETWFHKECALIAMSMISEGMLDGAVKVWEEGGEIDAK